MTERSPPWPLVVEEATENHFVGSWRGVALVFAYEGSHADVGHVHVGARVVERLRREQKEPVKLLFVLPAGHAKPPEPIVRSQMAKAARRLEGQVDRAALVVLGTGFAAAIHRGAIAGVLTVLRAKIPVKVVGTVREGLSLLIDSKADGFEELARRSEALAVGPSPPFTKPPSAIPRSR